MRVAILILIEMVKIIYETLFFIVILLKKKKNFESKVIQSRQKKIKYFETKD
jgi:hypothetical protein